MTLKTKNTRIAKLEISDLSFTKEGLSEYVYLNSELYLESIALANKKSCCWLCKKANTYC